MANKLKQLEQWLGKKRPFRVDWFAKDPQQSLAPEEALFNMPEPMGEKLIEAANHLPIPPKQKQTVMDALQDALADWQARPHVSPNSLVIVSEPVSSVSRLLLSSLIELRETREKNSLSLNVLDWVERPAVLNTIKQQIQQNLDLPEEGAPEEDIDSMAASGLGPSSEQSEKERGLMVIPNLCWCFLRSADGLDGLDYLQDMLPRDRAQFWVIGSGIVGWEYLKSTLKFHAYCGKLIHLPALSGEDLQKWLNPLVEEFDIYFPDAALHKRLQDPQSLLDFKVDAENPIESLSQITQEVSVAVQSSARALKDELLKDELTPKDNTPKRDFFARLADISDGVSEVALQLFIKSLRYREVAREMPRERAEERAGEVAERPKTTAPETDSEVTLTAISAPDSKQARMAGEVSESDSVESAEERPDKAHRLVAMMPKLPPLPDLSQSDLYLLYSLMLHGDMTVRALANSLGDAPNVVTNQVQILRKAGIVEQKKRVLKVNPVHYPKARRELAKNNFIIEVP